MQTKKENVEDFKAAISSTVRSISNSEKVEVIFGNQISKSSKNSLNLPNIEKINDNVNFEEIRAIADSKSLKLRFSKSEVLKRFEPQGSISRKLYNISEKIRCEKIGTTYFKGCLLYTSPSPRDRQKSRMPSSA